jgi:hypothetical protein
MENTRWWRSPAVLVAAGVAALVAVVLAVGLVTTAAVRRTGGWADDRVVAGPRDGRSVATLELLDGADTVTVRAVDLGDELYRVATPDGSRLRPQIADRAADDGGDDGGDVVSVRLVERPGEGGASAVEVRLHAAVRWSLRLLDGATTQVVDLSGGRLAGLDVVGGVTRLEVALPSPDGVVPVRVDGGAGQVRVTAPDGAPVRVQAGGGAGTVTVDGAVHQGVAAGVEFVPPGWPGAADRYDVVAGAGVGTLTVDRR